MFRGIDLYSDTVTRPSREMKLAMCEAELGDEQKGEDPTTLQLEETVANLTGHSAAMLFPSATMANEIAIRAQCEPGDELIADENCHLFFAEAGGPSIHAGVQAHPISTSNGIFTGDQIRKAYRFPKGPHYPVSKLVSIENTTNMGGGIAWTSSQLDSAFEAIKELQLKAHLDGSRVFNASLASKMSLKEIANRFDTVTICFSKGLCCPTGAVLAFDKKLWPKMRRLKQLFGGSMRQSGILAAACLYALKNNVNRLEEDHANAKFLAKSLSEIEGIEVEKEDPHSTNMMFFRLNSKKISPENFLEACLSRNLRFSQVDANRFRAVTHADISRKNIEDAIKILSEIV